MRHAGIPFLVLMLVAGITRAETLATLDSPGGTLTVTVTLDADGRPGYAIARNGAPVIAESRLGFILSDSPKLDRGFRLDGVERKSHDQTWEQPWGERRFVRDRHQEMRVRLVEKRAGGRRLHVVFRAFDDGVGFRYEFPEQESLRDVGIVEELTEFAVAEPATAWWITGGELNMHRLLTGMIYIITKMSKLSPACSPFMQLQICIGQKTGLDLKG